MRRRVGQIPARTGPAVFIIAAVAVVALVAGAALLARAFSSSDSGPGDFTGGLLIQPTPAGAADAREAAGNFLESFTGAHYGEMWGTLATPARTLWGKSDTLSAFLGRKFGGKKLSFSLGTPAAPAAWRDPDTGTNYESAVAVPLSLTVDGREAKEFGMTPIMAVNEHGKWLVAGLGPAGRRAPVFTPVPQVQGTMNVPILVYHHVRPVWPDDFEQRTITVVSSDFESQLAHLRDTGYHTVSLSELTNALLYGLPLPPKPVALTFDDGYDDMYLHAFPLLQKYGLMGSFGLITGYIGNPGYLTWDQAREMQSAGMEMVSHTVNHVDLGNQPVDAATKEIGDSRATLEEKLGRTVQTMIYPYGEPFAHGSAEQQQTVLAIIKQEGYASGVTNPLPNEAPNIVQDASLPYQLKRVMVSGGLPLNRYSARLEGRDLH